MRARMFRMLRDLALFGLALVLMSVAATLVHCTFGLSGRNISGQFLDMVCPIDDPLVVSETHVVLALFNRLTMPALVGGFLLLASAMMAVLFHFAFPKEPVEAKAQRFPFPGRVDPKRVREYRDGAPRANAAPAKRDTSSSSDRWSCPAAACRTRKSRPNRGAPA